MRDVIREEVRKDSSNLTEQHNNNAQEDPAEDPAKDPEEEAANPEHAPDIDLTPTMSEKMSV